MGYPLKQGQTAQPLVFLMVDATDHLTGKTGLSPVVTISKNGGAFASPLGTVNPIGSGWYKVEGNITDSGTLGPLLLHATATGADPVDELFHVVAFDPLVTSMGLVLAKTTNLTNLNDIPATAIVSGGPITTAAGAVSSVENVTGSVGSVTDRTGFSLVVTPPTASQVADAVWDESQSGHATAGTFGAYVDKAISSVSTGVVPASDIATAVNATLVSEHGDGPWATADLTTLQATATAIKGKTDNLPASPAAVGSAMTLAPGSIGTATFAAGATLPRVTLVDTCTTNTDMRGTDNAALATDLAALATAVSDLGQAVGEGQITTSDVASVLTTQGYTTARAAKLDHLDADVSEVSVGAGGIDTAAIAVAVRDVDTSATTPGTLGGDLALIRSQTTDLAASMIQPDTGTVTSALSPTATKFSASGDSLNQVSGAYTAGDYTMAIYFTSGANAGKSTKITNHTLSGSAHLFTVTPLPAPPAAGDTFLILGILPA